ncbi:hypothetical protein Pelo_8174 [Pelomyxa schiedti]|nr:hypothetical protein Pelo_8174 [Pelomyxa schiedti]
MDDDDDKPACQANKARFFALLLLLSTLTDEDLWDIFSCMRQSNKLAADFPLGNLRGVKPNVAYLSTVHCNELSTLREIE